jgi:hypothetical protein
VNAHQCPRRSPSLPEIQNLQVREPEIGDQHRLGWAEFSEPCPNLGCAPPGRHDDHLGHPPELQGIGPSNVDPLGIVEIDNPQRLLARFQQVNVEPDVTKHRPDPR